MINAAEGKETDWGSELANVPANTALDLVLGGRYKDTDLKSGAEDVKIGVKRENNVESEIAKSVEETVEKGVTEQLTRAQSRHVQKMKILLKIILQT